jgi:hypothetical protein
VASILCVTLRAVHFILSLNLTEDQRGQLAVEAQFYGLLRLMMPTSVPYYAEEQIGVALLQRACSAGNLCALQTAVATARALVFEMGSTTPWIIEQFQDLRYVITDRVVNGAPVWVTEDGGCFMYRGAAGRMFVSTSEASCAAGEPHGVMYNVVANLAVLAPTQLLSKNGRVPRLRRWKRSTYPAAEPPRTPGWMFPTCVLLPYTGWTTRSRRWPRRYGSSPRSPATSNAPSIM